MKKIIGLLLFSISSFAFAESRQEKRLETDTEGVWQLYATRTIIDIKENCLTLDNGSEWAVGYWWQTHLKTWEIGDLIQLSTPYDLAYYFYKIDNLTKQDLVWSTEKKWPNSSFAGCLWVQEIQEIDIDTGYLIKLNQGIWLRIPAESKELYKHWQPGDVLTIIAHCWPNDKPALLHHSSSRITGIEFGVLVQSTQVLRKEQKRKSNAKTYY